MLQTLRRHVTCSIHRHSTTSALYKPYKLSAIEIAEGALLADIAVVFQLLVIYLPFGGGYIALLVPIPFTVLILRRSFYAGVMSFCVACFIIGVLTGPGSVIITALEAGAGVFLGLTMKYCLRHIPLIFLGVTGSALLLFGGFFVLQLLSGVPFTHLILIIHKNYLNTLSLLGFVAARIGLGGLWKHTFYPPLAGFAQLVVTYWWAVFFVAIWVFLWPVVSVVYFITNFFVRLLGYQVRPFPGGIIERFLRKLRWHIIQQALKLGLGKRPLARSLIKGARGLGLAWYMQEKGSYIHKTLTTPGTGDNEQSAAGRSQGSPFLRTSHGEDAGQAQGLHQSTTPPLVPTGNGPGKPPLIDIQHVTYAYPGQEKDKAALRDVSLQVQQGEYLVILGHNGSGKSTLARHCNALLTPTSGHVFVAGMDTRDRTQRRSIRDMVGMIFQTPDNQIIATVVEDDVAWALAIRGLPASLIRERVAYAMHAVGITHLRKRPPHKLSGGQRQRLAIAGVLALRPQCIIADEATAQLDPLSRQEIVELLHQLNHSQNTGPIASGRPQGSPLPSTPGAGCCPPQGLDSCLGDREPAWGAGNAPALGLYAIDGERLDARVHSVGAEPAPLTIIQVTHLLEEAALADRIVVMEQGQIVMEGPPASVFGDLDRLRELRLAIPEPVELVARLRAAGLPISPRALTIDTIAQELMH